MRKEKISKFSVNPEKLKIRRVLKIFHGRRDPNQNDILATLIRLKNIRKMILQIMTLP